MKITCSNVYSYICVIDDVVLMSYFYGDAICNIVIMIGHRCISNELEFIFKYNSGAHKFVNSMPKLALNI